MRRYYLQSTRLKVMLPTAIIGLIGSVLVAVLAESYTKLSLILLTYYPIMWLVIGGCLKKYFKDSVLTASIVTSPCLVCAIVSLITNIDLLLGRYNLFGIVASILIFEFIITDIEKPKRRREKEVSLKEQYKKYQNNMFDNQK